MSVAAKGNAVEASARTRDSKLLIFKPNLQLVTAGLESQDLGGESVRDKDRAVLTNGDVVAKRTRARQRRADLSLSGAEVKTFEVASADRARPRYPKRRHII